MPKRVQMVRHSESAANLYVGLAGQITVDETNNEIRVHNGATAGGVRTARQDLANVANATSGAAGKMSATHVANLEQVITDLDAAEVLIAANAADIDTNAAAITTLDGLAAKKAANLSDLASAPTAVTNLGLDPEADAAYTAGTSTTKQATTPAKIRKAIQSFLNWPAGVQVTYYGASLPAGTLRCDGAAISRTTYAALFAAIGTAFGAGDGSTTFNLPNEIDNVSVGSGGTYARGDTGGEAAVALVEANLPAHAHNQGTLATASAGTHSHDIPDRDSAESGSNDNARLSNANTSGTAGTFTGVVSAGAHTHTISGSTGSTGSGTAHENMPPYLATPKLITTGGV